MIIGYGSFYVKVEGCAGGAGAGVGCGAKVGPCGCCEACVNGGLGGVVGKVASGIIRGVREGIAVGDDVRTARVLADGVFGRAVEYGDGLCAGVEQRQDVRFCLDPEFVAKESVATADEGRADGRVGAVGEEKSCDVAESRSEVGSGIGLRTPFAGVDGSSAPEEDVRGACIGEYGAVDESSVDPFGGKTGRARRKAKRRFRESCKNGSFSESGSTGVVPVDCSDVPEWRRKDPKALVHKGAFSDCSAEVRRRLVETRAEMLVARNEAAKVKAEVEVRRTKALLKSQEVERSVELKRLKTEAGLKVEIERKFGVNYASGFAQTVISEGLTDVISVPSLDGSVSPDSSISVDGVRKLESAVARLAQENSELKSQVDRFLKSQDVVGEKPKRDFQNTFEEELAAWEAMGQESSYHEGLTGLGDDDIRESEAIFDRTRANGFMSSADKVRNDAINAKVIEFRRLEKIARDDERN